MKILAFDTATEACSVALKVDDKTLHRFELTPRLHTSFLLPMIEQVLAEGQLALSQLDGIAFGRGPGMFTGLRIAAAAAQALAFGVDIPIFAVSSLEALALGAHQQFGFSSIMAAIDARMAQVYAGTYRFDSKLIEVECEENLFDINQLLHQGKGYHGVGSGCELFKTELYQLADVQPGCYPLATAITELAVEMQLQGKGLPAEFALPVYLRNKVT